MTKIYNYHPVTSEFLGDAIGDVSPLEPGVILLPAFSTVIPPPDREANQAAVYADGAWTLVADRRGVTYWMGGVPTTITTLGVIPPEGSSLEAPPIVPRAVTMRQARLALLGAGMLATVNGAVSNMQGDAGEAARIEWEYSQEVQRDKALILALAPVLGLTDAQLDALFIAAAAL